MGQERSHEARGAIGAPGVKDACGRVGWLQKTLNFISISRQKLLFTFAKKCYLLKEKILGQCLGCPQHNKGNKDIIFLSLQNNGNRPYAADNQDIAPEFFPLRDNIFLANVKSSFFPEIEIKFRVFCNHPTV